MIDLATELLRAHICLKQEPAWQRDAVKELTGRYRGLFDRIGRETITRLKAVGVPGTDLQRQVLVMALVDAIDEFGEISFDGTWEAARHGGQRVVGDLRGQGVRGISWHEPSPDVEAALRNRIFQASERTMNRIVGDVKGVLLDSHQQGFGIDKTATALGDKFEDMKRYELERIARTEIHEADGAAADLQMKELGVEYEQWITALDGRERESHAELHGEIIRVGDTFSNGLEYPGDMSGEPEDYINCRCRARPYILPRGKRAPGNMRRFREEDLLTVEKGT